jgi:hypothetical protein
VSGHVPVHMRAEEVVRAGYDELQHMNMLFLNFFVDRDTDTRTKLRFTLVGDRAPDLDLDSAPVAEFITLLRERGTVVDPTLATFELLYLARPGELPPGWEAVGPRLPLQLQRELMSGGLAAEGETDARYREAYRRMLDMARRLHAVGVPIVAGTDLLAGFALHRELELLAQAGLPAGDVLALATIGAARVMKRDGETGSIARGKAADLVLVDGDPLARVGDVRNTVLTVKGGVVYDAAEVHAIIGVRPR